MNPVKKSAKKVTGFNAKTNQVTNTNLSNPEGIDWAAIAQKLPMDKTPEQLKRRQAMFRLIDNNGNG